MRINPKRVRSTERMTTENCTMLSLAEAVRRESVSGFFPMAERSEDGGFEASDNNIDPAKVINQMSKVGTALRGIDLAGKTIVASPEPEAKPTEPVTE